MQAVNDGDLRSSHLWESGRSEEGSEGGEMSVVRVAQKEWIWDTHVRVEFSCPRLRLSLVRREGVTHLDLKTQIMQKILALIRCLGYYY